MTIISTSNRRDILKTIAAGAIGATLPFGALRPAFAADKRIAMVVKNLGNSYFDACRDGAMEAAKAAGGVEIIYTAPTKATAEDQIAVIDAPDRPEGRRHHGLGQRRQRARAGRQEGDAARHQGDLLRFGHRPGRPHHASQRLLDRPHRRQAGADDRQDAERRGRGRHPLGRLDHDQPELLDRGHEEGMGEARIRQDEARRHRLWRRPGRQELSRDAGSGEDASQPQGRHLADHDRHPRRRQGDHGRRSRRQGLHHRPRPAVGDEGRRAQGRLRDLRDLEPGRLRLFRHRDHARHPGRRRGGPGSTVKMGRKGETKVGPDGEAAMGEPFTFDKSNVEQFAKIF